MHSPPHYMQSDRYHLAAATYSYILTGAKTCYCDDFTCTDGQASIWRFSLGLVTFPMDSSCSHSASIEGTTHNYGEDRSWVQHDFYLNLYTFDWDQKSIWCWILHQFKFSYLTLSLLYYNPLIKLTFCLFMHLAGFLWQKASCLIFLSCVIPTDFILNVNTLCMT